jgi:geranylgeranyl pyrophosphate synthase
MGSFLERPHTSPDEAAARESGAFLTGARRLIARRVGRAVGFATLTEDDVEQLLPGKMLRSRLAARLIASGATSVDRVTLRHACAATELVHTASLCHDDVVDNAVIRRARPALWQTTGPSAAILIGDLLLCEALELVLEVESGRLMPAFVAKVREVIRTEAEQELLLRGRPVDEAGCVRVARGKTGPLFALVARLCGGDDADLAGALEEAGYRIGTAYQLADDLLDVIGDEGVAGKTLGTDSVRRKFTLPLSAAEGGRVARRHVAELCESALARLKAHPAARSGLREFLSRDLQPVLDRHLDVCADVAEY